VIEKQMSHMTARMLAILLLIALIIVAGPYLRRLGGGIDEGIARLNAELQHWLPVYSAETLRHKEAEYIRDRLPKRFPTALFAALLVLFAAAVWWLTR
jgi:hypothetical protein